MKTYFHKLKLRIIIIYDISDTSNRRWSGTAYIPVDYFPPNVDRFNLYSIHGTESGADGGRTYKSFMPVPGLQPDFHRLEHFKDFSSVISEYIPCLKSHCEPSKIWREAIGNK